MSETLNAAQVFDTLQEILCEILVLNPEEVRHDSKLMDDLDADSIAFLELTFRIRSDFGLEVPQAKVDEETLSLPLIKGMQRMEQMMGGTTLFEFMKAEATNPEVANKNPLNFFGAVQADAPEEAIEKAQQTTITQMAEQMGTSVPDGFDASASISTLHISDLFRFITVDAYVNYIVYLSESQKRIAAMGGADAMNAEAAAKARAQ